MKRHALAFLLAILMVALVLPSAQAGEADPYADIRGKTLSYWYPMWQLEADFVGTGDMGDLAIYKALEEKTGVTIEWIHPPVAENATAYNVLMASQDLPDIITHEYYVYYPGGADKAIDDGVYYDLKPLMEEYAPNYWKLLQDDPKMLRDVTTDAGAIWCFYMIDSFAQPSYGGVLWRKDLLDQLGLDVPQTIDQTREALRKFKDELGMEGLTNFPKTGYDGNGSLISAYGVKANFYHEGDTVIYGPIKEGYLNYLTEMNAWYQEGLIPKDFMAYDTTLLDADVTSGRFGFIFAGFYIIPTWNRMMNVEPGSTFVAGPYPSLVEGEKVNFKLQTYRSQQNCTAVTTSCKEPEVAVKWLDAKFDEDIITLGNYGAEGVTFEYVDGKPTYTDFAVNNPNGDSLGKLLYQYGFGKGPYYRILDRNWFTYPDEAIDAMYIWEASSTGEGELPEPFLTMTPEEGEEYTALMADIKTYVDECCVKFITGEMALDQWDSYCDTLDRMNIGRAIELKQAAYARYLAR